VVITSDDVIHVRRDVSAAHTVAVAGGTALLIPAKDAPPDGRPVRR
jgi:hypothetical protein